MRPLLETISSRDLSIVIQGPLHRKKGLGGIDGCLQSIVEHAPNAEIIISTWPYECLVGLDPYIIVTPEDPGGFQDNLVLNNINRQLISTKAGLARATRPYVLKLRSDLRLTGENFFKLGFYNDGQNERLFERPVTVTNLFTRNPAWSSMLFHISDLVQLGTRADMQKLWRHGLFKESEVLLPRGTRLGIAGHLIGYTRMKNAPEQLYIKSLLKQAGHAVDLPRPTSVSPSLLRLSDRLLVHDFHLIDHADAGIAFPERFMHPRDMRRTLCTSRQVEDITRSLETPRYKLRIALVYLNKFLLCYFTIAWWRSCVAKILYRYSPKLATALHRFIRRRRLNGTGISAGKHTAPS